MLSAIDSSDLVKESLNPDGALSSSSGEGHLQQKILHSLNPYLSVLENLSRLKTVIVTIFQFANHLWICCKMNQFYSSFRLKDILTMSCLILQMALFTVWSTYKTLDDAV